MKKLVLFMMVLIPLVMNAQNTSPNAQPSAFVGTYSFVDADGSQGTITLNSTFKTDKNYGTKYFGTGTCVFNGVTNYFSWEKHEIDYIELRFSKGDFPQFAVKGNPYKNDVVNITAGSMFYYIKDGWLYYDEPAKEAENPNLRFKLTKK